MKKATVKYKNYLLKKSRKEVLRRQRRNKRRENGNGAKAGFIPLIAPSNLTLFSKSPRKRLISYVKSIRRLVAKGKLKLWLDFSNTEKVNADGMIYLHAEICRISDVISNVRIKSTAPRNKVVAQVFKKVGFSKLINCSVKDSPEGQRKDVANWRSASGDHVHAEECGLLLKRYKGRIALSLSKELFKGMSEAMTNAHQHAYISRREDGLNFSEHVKPWWLFSQELEGKLTVVFCDLGVGIPESLPRTKPMLMEKLYSLFGKRLNDAITIQQAVMESISRTKQAHRGKGLRQIKETVNKCDDGKMYILSNYGGFIHEKGCEEKTVNYSNSIQGTIISWSVSIESYDENVAKYEALAETN